MTTPTDPTQNIPSFPSVSPAQLSTEAPTFQTSQSDPTGMLANFLATPGNPASPQEVETFIQGMMKFFNTMIQQQQANMQQANQQLQQIEEEG